MRVLRPLVAVAAVLVAALVAPAQAHLAPEVRLTGTTVVQANRSGTVDVVVPDDAMLSPKVAANPDVTFSGSGRYVGLWLDRLEPDGSVGTDGLAATRLPAFAGAVQQISGSYYPAASCTGTPAAFPVQWTCSNPQPKAILLHEGRYRLTLLTDGSPLTVTLTLHGLAAGTTDLTPTRTLASAERPLPVSDSLRDRMVTFGTTAPVAGPVLGVVLLTAHGSTAPLADGVSTCEREDAGTPPPFAYGPACPGGTGGVGVLTVHGPGQDQQVESGFVSTGTDGVPVGLGGSLQDSGGVTLGSTLGVWLEQP